MATNLCDSSALLAATLLDGWFSDYALFHETPPHGDKQAVIEWRFKRSDNWPGFRNVCQRLAEWTDGLADPSLDSASLHILSGSAMYLGILPTVPDETWTAAWALCSKLRSRVGTPDQAANAVVIGTHIEAIRGEQETTPAEPASDHHPLKAIHSPDFSDVTWYGDQYKFTPTRAKCVKILWRAWETGSPTVGGKHIVEELDLGTTRTLANVFRDRNGYHSAWGRMIVRDRAIKGAYRLNDPNDPVLQVVQECRRTGKRTRTHIEKRTATHKK